LNAIGIVQPSPRKISQRPFFAGISIFSRFAIPQLPLWRGKIKNVLLISRIAKFEGNFLSEVKKWGKSGQIQPFFITGTAVRT